MRGGNLPNRRLVVASEYERLTRSWIANRQLDASFVRSYGATEVFPPEDADVIVDNTATGETLAANGLAVVDELMPSSTRFYASQGAVADPDKKGAIDGLVLSLRSVLDARKRVMLELNVSLDRPRRRHRRTARHARAHSGHTPWWCRYGGQGGRAPKRAPPTHPPVEATRRHRHRSLEAGANRPMSSPATYLPPGFAVPIDLDLSKNEGRSRAEELLDAIDDPRRLVGRYPDTSPLRARLAALHGVSEDRVLVTAGGDDALSRCFLARVSEGGEVVSTYPTFEMIPRYSEQRGATLSEVPWWTGPFPVDEVLAAISDDTDAVFIVSPNNPTGGVATEIDLLKVAGEARLLVLDAAYVEFAESDPTPALLELGQRGRDPDHVEGLRARRSQGRVSARVPGTRRGHRGLRQPVPGLCTLCRPGRDPAGPTPRRS